MGSRLWLATKLVLVALTAIGFGVLLGNALKTQFLFFPEPITGTTRLVITVLANLLCLVPLLVVLLSALVARRFGWQAMAVAFLLPIFVVFALVTLV